MDFENQEDLNGLKGWLLLVGLGVVLAPFRIAAVFFPTFIPLISEGTWRVLVTPGHAAYNPLWIPLLALEFTYNIGMMLAAVWLNALFFTKHRFFPRVYIALAALPLLILPLDAWLVSLILPENAVFDEQTVEELIRSLVACAIWIPYMLKSKRVAATFIRGQSQAAANRE